MMRLIIALVICIFLLIPGPVFAIYDPVSVSNNKFGIHILFPSELEQAARLVNSSGGQWGYVTIPIRSDDRNLEKWESFMNLAKKLKLIPILRLASYPDGAIWAKPTVYDPLDWANFLSSLNWPTKNRYIIVYNEVNHSQEWGGEVNPKEYTEQLIQTSQALKRLSSDFFVLPAGLDASAPNSSTSMDEYDFIKMMREANVTVFNNIDGWTSHSYPNPNFVSSPYFSSRYGINSFQWELKFLHDNYSLYGLKVFITETGWNGTILNQDLIAQYFDEALNKIWNQNYVVAVTPFLLSAGEGGFRKFSWTTATYQPLPVYEKIKQTGKILGQPQKSEQVAGVSTTQLESQSNWSAQKTGVWSKTTMEIFKTFLSWLMH